ncbi:MAG: hypothetical protein CMH61_02800 [Nanoarchaeota archaeon]|nr:hypothetical protein [Nanoarchaeota archaeon]|tara:strand:- start:2732 stop:3385 length:654 start_codon:yes stop_codon:yes gene_type:complete
MSLFAIIPCYNEEKTIADVIDITQKHVDHVVVVDDGSADNTEAIAQLTGVTVLRHDVNLGKGAALKTGCDYAYMHHASKMVVLDGDGQHDANEIPRFVEALKKNDIVFGSRTFSKEMPSVLKKGNEGLNLIVQLLYGVKLKDTQSGFRAFTVESYKKIRWTATDYSMESEMIANVGKNKLRYKELEIKTKYLDRYKGTTVVDGLKIGMSMLLWRLRK